MLPSTAFSQSQSIWVRQNPYVAELLTRQGTLCIHRRDRDGGMKCVAIHPYLGNERHLNKPIVQLLDKPMTAAKPNVAHNKIAVAHAAIESGEREEISYIDPWSPTGEDKDLKDWHLTYTAFIAGDEIIMLGYNNELSERNWWEVSSL